MRRAVAIILLAAASLHAQDLHRWELRLPGPPLGNPLSFNPLNPSTIYGAVGQAGNLSVSRDGGLNWKTFATVPGGGLIKSIVQRTTDSSTFLAGVEHPTADKVVRTTDAGKTWTTTLSGNFSYYGVPLEYSDLHADTVYTMVDTTVYRSIDFGATWEARGTTGGMFDAWCDAAVSPADAGVLIIGDNSTGIWRSTDGGATFANTFPTFAEIPMIAIDPFEPATVYATQWGGGTTGLLKSPDGGSSWTDVPAFDGLTAGWGVAWNTTTPGSVVFGLYTLAPDRGNYLSDDGGASWSKVSCGLTIGSAYFNYGFLSGGDVTLALQGDGIYLLRRRDDGGLLTGSITGALSDSASGEPVRGSVTLRYETCDGPVEVAGQTDSAGAFRFDDLIVTDSGFANLYTVEIDPEFPNARLVVENISLDTSGFAIDAALPRADVLLAGDDTGTLAAFYQAALDSVGLTYNFWNIATKGVPPYQRTSEVNRSILIYFGGSRTTPFSAAELEGLDSCIAEGNSVFLTGQNILELNAGTAPFTRIGVGYGGGAISSYCKGIDNDVFDGYGFFTTGAGAGNQTSRDILVAESADVRPVMGYGGNAELGASAVCRDPGAGNGYVMVFGFGFEAIHTAATRAQVMERVVAFLEGKVIIDDVPQEPGPPVAREFRLHQSYPNPFNATAAIPFDLPSAGDVELEITNVVGERIWTHSALYGPGRNTLRWEAGERPAGVYYYSVRFADSVLRGKMLLVR